MHRIALTLLLGLLMPLPLYAITCPTNGKFLEEGDSIKHVMQLCGKPALIKKDDNSLLYDGSMTYSDPDGPNVEFKISHQHVTAIYAATPCDAPPCSDAANPVNFYPDCYQYVYIGNNVPYVIRSCGKPQKIDFQNGFKDVTKRLIYNSTAGPNVLVFHNDELIDWETQ